MTNNHGAAGLAHPSAQASPHRADELAPTFPSAPWIAAVLLAHRLCDLEQPAARDLLATAIVEAIPRHVIVACIRESARAVLLVRGIADEDGRLAAELANNSAASVLLMLELGEETT